MRDLDRMVDEALNEEERALLRSIGEEPHFIAQTLGIFGGRTGWVSGLMLLAQALLFAGGVWAAFGFFQAGDALAALRWGVPAATLLLMSLIIKMSMWPTLEANRVIRELKRIELQIAHSANRTAGR